MMKQNRAILLLLLLLLFLISQSSGRLLKTVNSGGDSMKENKIIALEPSSSDQTVNLSSLMGASEVEDCEGEEAEDCMTRRMMAEAHLDYIYTQHHRQRP
ncbi:hypothetical protein SAY87_026745 [Trapa incisa]|uniref:Phytosulfokine n=1 Tax=Trapa incisa TaxID=236973 RepID=A0AAN7GQR0_9MYRT|nr:hypothetical protein SAY87_026745 [Trapa incisa]